jgi:murein DD-endopeptidase MepM/ murein hydrolase activator NlpD
MSRFKLYYFSPRSLEFVEARWCKTRLTALSIASIVMIVGISIEANRMAGDPLGLGFRRDLALRAENLLLRDQIRTCADNLRTLAASIDVLGDRGNEVRLMVDLRKVNAETRKAGFGGTDERIDLGVAGDVNGMLNDLRISMTKAEKEIQLQQVLYRDAAAKYEENSKMYPSLPAIKPMQGYFSMTGFGMRFHPVFHQMLLHEGLDIANAEGSPVYATGDGVVVSSGRMSVGLGIMIVINHGYGYTTTYGHLSKVLVHSGERIKRGTLIARSGRTGIVTGPHLHYEVRLHGQLQNPVDYFFDGISYKGGEDRQTSPF